MKTILRLAGLALVAAIGFWLWTLLFPSPERLMERRLAKLARLASVAPDEGNIARLANIQRMGTFFTEDVEVLVEVPGSERRALNGREELTQAALGARTYVKGLKVEFLDTHVSVAPDRQSAVADLTLKAVVSGQKDLIVEELKFTFKPSDGDWLISRIETVKTFR